MFIALDLDGTHVKVSTQQRSPFEAFKRVRMILVDYSHVYLYELVKMTLWGVNRWFTLLRELLLL